MAIQFPDSPAQGDTHVSNNGVVYTYENGGWTANPQNITNLNGGQLAGFRNQLINSCFEINQRSITDTSDRNLYFVDRWFKGDSSGRIVAVDSTLSGFDRALSFSGAADSPIYQSIELPRTGKAGQFGIGTTWTLSCYARCSSGGDARLNKRFVNDTNQNVTDETAETFTLDTNWQHISFTFTIASAPNAANTALQVIFTSLTANELFVTGVQLEPGPVSTVYEHRPIGTELALCKRYYQTVFMQGLIGNYNSSGSVAFFNVACVPMRLSAPSADSINIQISTGRLLTSGGTSVPIASTGFFNRSSGRIGIAREGSTNTFSAVTCCTTDLGLDAEL